MVYVFSHKSQNQKLGKILESSVSILEVITEIEWYEQ